jgi:hypothetical protein
MPKEVSLNKDQKLYPSGKEKGKNQLKVSKRKNTRDRSIITTKIKKIEERMPKCTG